MKTLLSRTTTTISALRSGILGGFVATVLVSLMMLMNNVLSKITPLHLPQTLSVMLREPNDVMVGGIAFFIAGTFVFGILYPFIEPQLPIRSTLIKGLLCGLAIWLALMLMVMTLAGAGLFALHRSAIATAEALVLTLVYGIILAAVYAYDMAGGDANATANKAEVR